MPAVAIRHGVFADDVAGVRRIDVALRARAVDPLAADVVLKHESLDAPRRARAAVTDSPGSRLAI